MQPYTIPMDDEDEECNIYWYEMYQKLVEYKSTYGHCYVPSDYNQTNKEDRERERNKHLHLEMKKCK